MMLIPHSACDLGDTHNELSRFLGAYPTSTYLDIFSPR